MTRRARWLIALLLALLAPAAAAEEIVPGLAEGRVAIDATFDGSDLLIFGAVRREAPPPEGPPLEVIITVAGPLEPLTVRRAGRLGPIWVNVSAVEVDAAPSFYAVATTGPLSEVLLQTEDLRHAVTLPRAIRAIGTGVPDRDLYIDALLRLREAQGRYQTLEGHVTLSERTLFRAVIRLPPDIVEGDYPLRILLTRGGQVVDSFESVITVRKVGIERWLFDLSRERPLLYGLMSLAIAVIAGWAASLALQPRTR